MTESLRCPSCGASNAPGAQWCGQCFARFGDAPSQPAAPAPPPVVRDEPAAPPAGGAPEEEAAARPRLEVVRSGPVVRTKGQLRWTCPACESENPIEASVCSVCSTPMAALFGATPRQELRRVGPKAVVLSALLPGLGHGWAGRIGDAIARGVLFCWTLGIGLLLLTRRTARAAGIFRGIGAVFLIAAVAVWILAFLEAQRLARGDISALVPGRALMWASAALTGILFVGLTVATQVR